MSIVSDYGLSGPGFGPCRGKIFCSCPDWLWGPPSLLYSGYWLSFPGVKWPGRELTPTPSLEVKERVEVYLYTHTPKYLQGML